MSLLYASFADHAIASERAVDHCNLGQAKDGQVQLAAYKWLNHVSSQQKLKARCSHLGQLAAELFNG